MKKFLTLLITALCVSSAFATVTISSLVWQDGKTDDRTIEQGGGDVLTLTYTSDETLTYYLYGNTKVDGAWSNYWLSQAVALVPGVDNTVDIPVTVPVEHAVTDDVRVFMATIDGGAWANRYTPNMIRYINVVEPAAPSSLVLTSLTWTDDASENRDVLQNSMAQVKVVYTGSGGESIFANICYKDAWGTIVASVESILPSGDGSVTIDVPVRAFDGSIPAGDAGSFDMSRIIIGLSATAAWGSRYDFGADDNANNDVVYAYVVASIVESVEEATAFVTDKQDEAKVPAGGGYVVKDSVIISLDYNSTDVSTFYVRFKSKDNATKFIEHDEMLPSTTKDTTYSFKVGIPEAFVPYDSVRIVGWIGSWSADKELEQWIDVTDNATGLSSLATAEVKVFPNPSTDILNVETASDAVLKLIDMNGKTIYQQDLLGGVNSVDVRTFRRGIYFLTVKDGNQLITAKVVLR